MLHDPHTGPPAPRPVPLSALVEHGMDELTAATMYASRLPLGDALAAPVNVSLIPGERAEARPFLAYVAAIGPDYDVRGAYASDVCLN